MIKTECEYAEALFTLAAEENAVEHYRQSLGTVKQLFEEAPAYTEFLNSPAIPLSERLQSIDEAFEGRMPDYVVSFLKVLCENGKIRTLLGCIDEFSKLAMSLSQQTSATIYSAVALSEAQKNGICQKLKQLTNKNIDPVYLIDESLIGGMKIEIDGKTFDGSLRHRLGEIKDVMNS